MKCSTHYTIKSSVSGFIAGMVIMLSANPATLLDGAGIILSVILMWYSFQWYRTAGVAKDMEGLETTGTNHE